MIKPLQCKNCKHFEEDVNYKGEGKCNNDGRYTREHRVCNLLDTDDKRRNAKKLKQYFLLFITFGVCAVPNAELSNHG